MTLRFCRPIPGRTRFGTFHNLDAPDEEVGLLAIHLFGASFEIYWTRRAVR
tara:strand:+ start:3071 stop:3223 length:153 start_codon:yes stop_codon:yes gene_type:complete